MCALTSMEVDDGLGGVLVGIDNVGRLRVLVDGVIDL